MTSTLGILALRFHLVAADAIHFPRGKPANVLRGAFGAALKRIAPAESYSGFFEPSLTDGPSGLADSPRPFVFRARELDGRVVGPGEAFDFGVNLFDVRRDTVAGVVNVVSALA